MNLTCLLREHDWDRPKFDARTRTLAVSCARCGATSSGVEMVREPRVIYDKPDDRWKAVPAQILPWLRRRA